MEDVKVPEENGGNAELIFGEFKTIEEAEAAFKQGRTDLEERNGKIAELEKAPPAAPPARLVSPEGELAFTDEEKALFDPAVLAAMEKREKILVRNLTTSLKTETQMERAKSEQEDWIIENFTNEENPDMGIQNEKGKFFQLAQKIWKTSYNVHPLYQKVAVLEAYHQLSGKSAPAGEEPKKKTVGSYETGSQYQVGAAGKEMPWDEFVKLPEWKRNEVLAEEAGQRVNNILGKK